MTALHTAVRAAGRAAGRAADRAAGRAAGRAVGPTAVRAAGSAAARAPGWASVRAALPARVGTRGAPAASPATPGRRGHDHGRVRGGDARSLRLRRGAHRRRAFGGDQVGPVGADHHRACPSPRDRPGPRSVGGAGMVTAELAVVLPALLLVLAVALSALGLAVDQVRCVDAARPGPGRPRGATPQPRSTQWQHGPRHPVRASRRRSAGDW